MDHKRWKTGQTIKKTSAVDKIPLYGKFEVNLTARKVERMVKKHYNIVPGSFRFEDKIKNYPESRRVESFLSFFADNADDPENYISGSINIALEVHGTNVRSYAYVRIDG